MSGNIKNKSQSKSGGKNSSPFDVTNPSQLRDPKPLKEHDPKATREVVGLESAPKEKSRPQLPPAQKSSAQNRGLPFLLLGIAGLLLLIALTQNSEVALKSNVSDQSSLSPQDRFERHKLTTGTKINMERLQLEMENNRSLYYPAPPDQTSTEDSMTFGVSQRQEPHGREGEDDKKQTWLDPDYPDARVQYILQEKEEKRDWVRQAQKQYVKDFIANAKRAGYDVRVDKDMNVEVLREPNGQSNSAPMSPHSNYQSDRNLPQ